LAAACFVLPIKAVKAQSLALDQRIELPSVRGRIDHMDVDVEGGRLFVAALGADSLEVIDLRAGRRVARIPSLHEPQGVLYRPEARRVFVANGSGGGVQAYADGKAPAVASAADLNDADNLRFDAVNRRVYAGYARALAVIDPDSLVVLQRIELAGHPESFQLETSGRLLYVNVPSAGHIDVIDRGSGKVTATWLTQGSGNFPMALDESEHRLFVVTRQPALLLVYDTREGKQLAETSVCGDADDLFIDVRRQQLYVVCGEGLIQIVRRQMGERYAVTESMPTSPGARTGLFVPKLSTLFVAVPARGGSAAQIQAYRIR
jgi:DNA-binding beta-propeller fold protein YncE